MTEKNEGVFDYIKEANLTASPSFHGEAIPYSVFRDALVAASVALDRLDVIKKALFYGKPCDIAAPAHVDESINELPFYLLMPMPDEEAEKRPVAIAMLHAIIGKATEAGELLDAILTTMDEGEALDEVNVIEEVGDGLWYDALLLKALNSTFDEAQRTNIRKLRLRYPNAFTEYDAMNRDLFGERKELEKVNPTLQTMIADMNGEIEG